MPVGARRFDRLVLQEDAAGDVVVRARFLPLNLGDAPEMLSEDEVRAVVEANAYAPHPQRLDEEQLALAAFKSFAKNPAGTNPSARAHALVQRQRAKDEPTFTIADILTGPERKLVERYRRMIHKLSLPERKDDPDFGTDTMRAILDLLDTTFPKPKG